MKLQVEIKSSTKIVKDFNTLLLIMHPQRVSEQMQDCNDTIYQLDLTYLYTTLYSTRVEYTCFF